MRTVLPVALAAAMLAVTGASAETASFLGTTYCLDHVTKELTVHGGYTPRGLGPQVVLDSVPANANDVNVAFSQPTSEIPDFGDVYTPAAAGTLDTFQLGLFNSASTTSGTPTDITAGTVQVRFFDFTTFTGVGNSTPLGTFTSAFDFTAVPLVPGTFTFVTVTNLASEVINLPASQVIMTYTWELTGSTRHGFVSTTPMNVGTTGGPSFYLFSTTFVEDLYVLPGQPEVNVSTQWAVIPAPATAAMLGTLTLLAARRRRG